MTATTETAQARATGRFAEPAILVCVFVSFLAAGCMLPALPLHVSQTLGLGPFAVGVIVGGQFAAAVATRVWAGAYCDKRGSKRGMLVGMLLAALSGVISLGSLALDQAPLAAASVLFAARVVIGAAESFIITGSQSWGLALLGPQRAGHVIARVGIGLFGALTLGAPLGAALYNMLGFIGVSAALTLAPLLALGIVLPLPAVAPQPKSRSGLWRVASAVWAPGLGAAFGSLAYGAMLAFVTLRFTERGWTPTWMALTAFSGAFLLARLLFGHLPDKAGGARVAFLSLLVDAVGLVLLGLAPSAPLALIGTALSGGGYALIYPGFGVEAVRRAPPEQRGLVMGAYTVFLDIALATASPLLGLLAGAAGLGSVFIAAAVAALGGALMAGLIINHRA